MESDVTDVVDCLVIDVDACDVLSVQTVAYSQAIVCIGSHAASFKRPLLSVDGLRVCVSACLCVNLMLNISETKRSGGSCPTGIL